MNQIVFSKKHVEVRSLKTSVYALGFIRSHCTLAQSFVAVAESFGLAVSGRTPKKARENLVIVIMDLLQGALRKKKIDKVLKKYGWSRKWTRKRAGVICQIWEL